MKSSIAIATLALAAAMPAHAAELIHRYSFNDGTANDSVGTAHGTLTNGATISGGNLVLANTGLNSTTGQSASLGTGSNVLPVTGSTTIEAWFNIAPSGFFTSAFTFANSTPPDATNGSYFMGNISFPANLDTAGGSRIVAANAGWTSESAALAAQGRPDNGFLDNSLNHMIAAVLNAEAGTLSYYIDGILQSTTNTTITLEQLAVTNAWLGRSAFGSDPAAIGTINEVRIYSGALTTGQISTNFEFGPNTVIPEPASLALLGAGALGLIARRRRTV
jgi:hypothetical protein